MVHWEYKTVKINPGGITGGKVDEGDIDAMLNGLGAEGWELTSAFDTNVTHGATRHVVLIMKRLTP